LKGRAVTGDALANMLLTHRATIVRYLRARGADDEIDDLLQEIWLRLAPHRGGEVGDPIGYLLRTAHNLMLDLERSETRRKSREITFHDANISSPEEFPIIDRVLLARERLSEIELLLQSLGKQTDFIFRRHRLDNISQREIAFELGITLSAVEKHLQKAYKALAGTRSSNRTISRYEQRTASGR
jgi:RNA polymerase sigma factor (sigma-70 family)